VTLDVNRVVATAIETAFENGHRDRRRHRLSGVGAVAAGMALATVARAATQKKVPRIARFGMRKLVDAPRFRDMSDRVRDRLEDAGLINQDEPAEGDRYEDQEWDDSEDYDEGEEEPEAEDEEDEEDEEEDDRPRGEADDDEPRDEDDNGNQGDEPDEDWEGEADEREDESGAPRLEHVRENGAGAESGDPAAARRGPPDLMQMLSGHRSPPPALARARRQEPLRRPPAPAPRDRSHQESKSKSDSKSKAPAGRKRTAGRN
jgi:hypothetical protein